MSDVGTGTGTGTRGVKRQRSRKASGVRKRPRITSVKVVAPKGGIFMKAPSAVEKKFFDTALSFLIDATGEVPATGQLALIPQGDTSTTRDGRQATIKSIQIRGSFLYAPAASGVAAQVCYLYLVLDRQANGAAAAVTDVFTSTDMRANQLNLNNSRRFRIMQRWAIEFNSCAGVTTAYNNVAKSLEYYVRCNIPMDWNSTTGAITEITSNNIFLIAGSDGNQDDTVSFNGSCRLRFVG